jgi:multiple sugar transport system permease protein
MRRREAVAGYLFIAIPLTLYAVYQFGALGYALFISFWRWEILGPTAYVGAHNYQVLLSDPTFHRAVLNSLYYAAVVVPSQMALGLLLAVIVDQIWFGRSFFRAAFYFPAIASSAAVTVLYIYVMAPDGLFNHLLQTVGADPSHFFNRGNWLGSGRSALQSIMVLNVWTTSGTIMLFYLAGLQSIPTELYEQAGVDGAGAWQRFRRITFPMLAPSHYLVAVTSAIGALQLFDQAYIAGGSDGSPDQALLTMVLYLYNVAFRQFEFGYAAAVGIVLFAVIFAITLVQRRFFGEVGWAAAR